MDLGAHVLFIFLLASAISFGTMEERGQVNILERHFLLNESSLEEFAERQLRYLNGKYADTAVLQDFDNLQYTMEIGIGTPQQKFKVTPDTGSSDLWVYSSRCSEFEPACSRKDKYHSNLSSTYVYNGRRLEINYGSGRVSGFLSSDNVHLTNQLVARGQVFGEVTHAPVRFAHWIIEGILGLAFTRIGESKATPVFESLVQQKQVSRPIFSIYLNRDLNSRIGGEIKFGGVDRSHINGAGIRAPLIRRLWYIFKLKEVCFGHKDCTEAVYRGGYAIADTGTSLIAGPTRVMRKINENIFGGRMRSGLYLVDCDKIQTLPHVTFKLEEGSLTLRPETYILRTRDGCISGFQGVDLKRNQPQWILGDVLLGEFYTVYNMGLGTESVTFYPAK